MRKLGLALLAAALMGWLVCAGPAIAESSAGAGEDRAAWTVMFYLCGSDLESRYGFATGNLMEISQCLYRSSFTQTYDQELKGLEDIEDIFVPDKVNVVIETGGSTSWSIDKSVMDVDPKRLQRWQYQYFLQGEDYGSDPENTDGFRLMESLPLASMAEPETLSDFIRWGAATCPAENYALVLWDHGGGSKTGLFVDELFDGDIMYLNELGGALKDGGVHFEAVLMDACLMANMETAWAIHESADWMIASEETVTGKGTAVHDWLQELICNPYVNGYTLGRNICDMTQIKYAGLDNRQARQLMTWSVIDLSKIEEVVRQFDRFFKWMDACLEENPSLIWLYAAEFSRAEEYGDGNGGMHDLSHFFYSNNTFSLVNYNLRRDMQNAISDAVVYVVRGSGRAAARGLSFCWATDFDADELDIYACNCPSPHYLALLDAVCDWDAPDEVFETARRLKQIKSLDNYQMLIEKRMGEDGLPGIYIDYAHYDNTDDVLYSLYQFNETTGQLLFLGRTFCSEMTGAPDGSGLLFSANDPMHWPAIDGVPCNMNLVRILDEQNMYIYNVPIQIGKNRATLRCGREFERGDTNINKYEVYGVWDGYDEDIGVPARNVKSLSQVAGQDYRLLYPVFTTDDELSRYTASKPLTMYRALDIREMPLPAGIYFMKYEVEDMFGRPHSTDFIEMNWDGQTITYPDDFRWEGETVLNPVED